MTEETKPAQPAVTETKKLSPLEETKMAIEELKRERAEIVKIRDELNQLRSDQLLSGTGGIPPQTPPKVETNKEYRKRIEREMREGKYK